MADKADRVVKEDSFEEILAKINARRKSSHLWTKGEPFQQPCFGFSGIEWKPIDLTSAGARSSNAIDLVTVLSWNIDFMRACPQERMAAALIHLHTLIQAAMKPCVVMLNEMMVSNLEQIQSEQWIRNDYYVTDISDRYWESGYYGTCMLVPKILPVSRVFRVHYEVTKMERDALFVDIRLANKTLRLCSTHLESLIADPPIRPHQMASAAKFMHDADASVLGGDLNAIQPFDKSLHSDNGLRDAYLITGGEEDVESGMTWGQMASTFLRNNFGLSRMDKFFFCGAVQPQNFESFGMDVEVEDVGLRPQLAKASQMEKGWVTDHLGVRADFKMLA